MPNNAEKFWTLFLVYESGRKRAITVKMDCLVVELIDAAAEEFEVEPEHMALSFSLNPNLLRLDSGEISGKNLSHFNIEDCSTLVVIFRMTGGGGWRPCAVYHREKTLKDLKGFVTVTTDSNDEDMLTRDNSPDRRRAKIFCGHVIGPDTMTELCLLTMKRGEFIVRCPYVDTDTKKCCNREWPFFVVRHVACLDPEELSKFEAYISQNVLNRAKGIQQCPGCMTYCFRQNISDKSAICPLCTKSKGQVYKFCWECLNEWKGGSTCGNNGCMDVSKRLNILKTCNEKIIAGIMTPSHRGCPRCGVIIEHARRCNHIRCELCGCDFCFICLLEKKGPGWSCSPFKANCKIAPRQTSLPRLTDKFEKFYD